MCHIWLRSDGRVEKKGWYRQTDRQTDKENCSFIDSRYSEDERCEAELVVKWLSSGHTVINASNTFSVPTFFLDTGYKIQETLFNVGLHT